MSTRINIRWAAVLFAWVATFPALAQNASVFGFTNASSVAQLVVLTSGGNLTFDQVVWPCLWIAQRRQPQLHRHHQRGA
jgi:hypothetical protein